MFDELLTPDPKPNVFVDVPKFIAEHGRVKGFEEMRDLVLVNWPAMSSVMAALKMALELDRHALMAEVALEKTKGGDKDRKWREIQRYLRTGKPLTEEEPDDEEEETDGKG